MEIEIIVAITVANDNVEDELNSINFSFFSKYMKLQINANKYNLNTKLQIIWFRIFFRC